MKPIALLAALYCLANDHELLAFFIFLWAINVEDPPKYRPRP